MGRVGEQVPDVTMADSNFNNSMCALCGKPLGEFGHCTPLGWAHGSCDARVRREAYERIAKEREAK